MRYFRIVALLLSSVSFSLAATNIAFPSDPVTVSGTNGLDGYIFRFNGVGTGIDAIVTNVAINNSSGQRLSGGITTGALGGTTSNSFVIDLSNDNSSVDPETGLNTLATGTTSTRMRMQFVTAGAIIDSAADITANLAPAADYIFTFYDIDTVSKRYRVDTITAFGVDGYYVEGGGTYLDDNNVLQTVGASKLQVTSDLQNGNVTAILDPKYTISVGPGDVNYTEHSISFLWNQAQTIEFEWSFPYTQKGTRGVEIDGSFPPGVRYADPIFTAVPEPSAIALWMGVTALTIVGRRRRKR